MDSPGRYNVQRCQRLLNKLNAELASVQAALAKLKAAGLRAVRPAVGKAVGKAAGKAATPSKPKHGHKAA